MALYHNLLYRKEAIAVLASKINQVSGRYERNGKGREEREYVNGYGNQRIQDLVLD